jgi:hypothetical protein
LEVGNKRPVKTDEARKNMEGEDDEKEYLDVTTNRLAGIGDVYRA